MQGQDRIEAMQNLTLDSDEQALHDSWCVKQPSDGALVQAAVIRTLDADAAFYEKSLRVHCTTYTLWSTSDLLRWQGIFACMGLLLGTVFILLVMWDRKRIARQTDSSGVIECSSLAAIALCLQGVAMVFVQERQLREVGLFAAPQRHIMALAFWVSMSTMPISLILVHDPAVMWPLNLVVATSVCHAGACQWAASSIVETKRSLELAKKHRYLYKSL